MLMIDPAKACAETRRVLRPGGRLALSVWAARQRNPQILLAGRVLVELGHYPPPNPQEPGAFAMADPERIRMLVVGAGLADPEIEEVPFRWRFADQGAYWRFLTEAAGSFSPVLRALSAEAQQRVWERVQEAVGGFRSGEGYDFPAVCLNALTHRF